MKIEQKKKTKTKNEKTQTIVDLEAMIEPTRPSYKHLRIRVVFLLTLKPKQYKWGGNQPTKTSITRGRPLLTTNDLLLFTLENNHLTSPTPNSDQRN